MYDENNNIRELNNNDYQKEINNDLIFFFLSIISALIAFYIVIQKKRQINGLPSLSYEDKNKLFQFRIYLVIFIDIYFVINAYNALMRIKNKDNYDDEEYNTQLIVLVSNVLILIAALMYIPIKDSSYVLTR